MTPPWPKPVPDTVLHPAVTSAAIASSPQHPQIGQSQAREIRILQGVEYEEQNLPYMCPTCATSHPARPVDGLNVLVSAGNLHDIHHPRDDRVRCPPDPIHIEWLTVCGATIADLQYAWELDYSKSNRPMRILRVLPLPMGLY